MEILLYLGDPNLFFNFRHKKLYLNTLAYTH